MKYTPLIWVVLLGTTFFPQKAVGSSLEEARQLYFAHHPEKALQMYVDISKQTQAKEAFLNGAFIALEQNKLQQAIDILLAAYRIYPTDNEITHRLGQLLLADGSYNAAVRALEPTAAQTAGLPFLFLARAQLKTGDTKTARENLLQATQQPLYRPLALYQLGLLAEQEKNFSQAATYLDQAISEDHQFFEARRAFARVLEKNGQPQEALRQYYILRAASKNDDKTQQAIARLSPLFPSVRAEKEAQTPPLTHTFAVPLPVPAGERVRIGLGVEMNGRPSVMKKIVFSPSHAFKIVNEKNIKIVQGKEREIWQAVLHRNQAAVIAPNGKKYLFKNKITVIPVSNEAEKEPTFILKNIVSGAGMTWMSVADKEYRGELEILHNNSLGSLIPINIVPMENYLQGVISAEMPRGFPLEALKAQTVLARTYAHKHKGKHKRYGYDLCDSQNCQVYGGVAAETDEANTAVAATHGNVLLYQKNPIEAVFSANTGGMTQRAKDAGWEDSPYLESSSDYKIPIETLQPYQIQTFLQTPPPAYDYYDKNVSLSAFRWARVMPVEDIAQVVKRIHKDIGSITALIIQKRSPSGYVTELLVKGTKGQITLNKENIIRSWMGLGMLRSSLFMIVPQYEHKKLTHFIFYGGGWGHGVGFDQTGAAGRADDGQSYTEILQHYFPSAEMQFSEGSVNRE